MQRVDIYRCYHSAYNFSSVLFNEIPFIIIAFYFAIPTLVIQSRYKNIILANNAGKALSVEYIFFKTEHHHFTCKVNCIQSFSHNYLETALHDLPAPSQVQECLPLICPRSQALEV